MLSPPPAQLAVACAAAARRSLLDRFRGCPKRAAEKGSVMFFQGGQEVCRHDTDHKPIFRQESNFHYLFGVREPDFLGAIEPGLGRAVLFAPKLPADYALWMGEIKSLDAIRDQYGVDEVLYAEDASHWLEQRAPEKVYVLRGRNSDSGSELLPPKLGSAEHLPTDESTLHGLVYECRAHKTDEELKLLRHVNRVSADAHIEVMRLARPGLMEFQLESTFHHSCHFKAGCRLLAYTPIVGSGPNSAILHYGHAGAPNDRRLEDGDMVLCDMGAELLCYASDITNTFPANGTFTANQRLIFETVAAMQLAVLSEMRPGVQWADMHALAYRVLCERLLAGGLLRGELVEMAMANVAAVLMPHGLGHLLGIDTHDVGGYPEGAKRDLRNGYKALRMQRALEPGMVLTVEPGVYFMKYALDKARASPELSRFFVWERVDEFASFGGVRLEDNVLVTEAGIENLTTAPRTPEEVEAVMRGEVTDSVALIEWRAARKAAPATKRSKLA